MQLLGVPNGAKDGYHWLLRWDRGLAAVERRRATVYAAGRLGGVMLTRRFEKEKNLGSGRPWVSWLDTARC